MEIASAVRIPSPEPDSPEPPRKREHSPAEAGPSKRSRRYGHDADDDYPPERPRERERERERDRDEKPMRRDRENGRRPDAGNDPRVENDDPRFRMFQNAFSAPKKLPIDDSKTRAGGAYIPPARLRAMQAAITDKNSPEYQRMAWEALKKSIQGMINKCNVANIKMIVPELFAENLVRGRGLFCRSIMKAQAASLPFTNIYAAMAAIVNTKLPQVGDLLVRRLIVQFRKGFKRNDKAVSVASSMFLSHLVNQQVVHEVIIAQMLLLLLNKPTDDSVEIAVGIMREVGQFLDEMNGPIANSIFDQFRNILHEADIDKRTQYMIEVLFQVRKDKYKDNPSIKEELDLVEEEDQITHRPTLEDEIKVEEGLNIFKLDAEYEEHEAQYQKLKAEILGEAEGSDEDEYTDASSEDDDEEKEERAMEIKDQTNADLVSLRRTIYLTIKSSGGFEECCHKLMRVKLPAGLEKELTSMIVECASQERTYEKFYGMVGERFCKLNRMWCELFQDDFVNYYDTIHRLETNRLRIVAQFFAHLLASDAIGWHVLSAIKLNEEDTTSSSRIFIKILFEELMSSLGQKTLVERLKDPMLQEDLTGLFPTDDQVNTRFAINFFTAVGMGVLTDDMRTFLANNAPQPKALPEPEGESDSESVSSYSSYSSRSRSRSRTPRRGRSVSDSRSRSRSRSYSSDSRSRSRRRSPSVSRSRSPAPRRRNYASSRSRSPASHRRRSISARADSRDSPSRNGSPRRPRRRGHSDPSPSRSRSRAPRRRRNYSSSRSRSPAPRRRVRSPSSSVARSRSPVERRRRHSSSVSRSRSPLRRRKRDSSSPPPRRRRDSSSPPPRKRRPSISPPPRRTQAAN
ncbi:MIF4G-domain-containing protein [Lindgomyces ingoldianus]|uniref:MIF4G-domain-containing protein n=1 Tax=Lindgomyces ingoldianus TaxID=673940 RepID=A0ACB6RAL7_9PLEO|nr:MIF4G-domain-containing protein [Lindgomyces ingoldianus]KAF2476323.1 MIF4G-domain-containing protein [Lindgomyces ingoldianus]